MILLFGARYVIDNHFGINPVNGGIPLRDNNNNGIAICSRGEVFINLVIFDGAERFLIYMIRKSGMIIIEYIIKYVIDMRGLISNKPDIHPKWVIEE